MAENTNDVQLDLSGFDIKPPAPNNTSEQFYRADPVKVEPEPYKNPTGIFDNFDNAVNNAARNTTLAPTSRLYYPKELTEKYKGTAAYSPWMDPYADNESVAAKNWGVWDAIGTGFSGLLDNALHAGKQYAMFYPRLGRAIVTLDPSQLKISEADLAVTAQELNTIKNKNPVFYDPGTSTDDIFSRQFLSETLQSTGFTFGTMGAFVAENAVTGGMSSVLPKLFKVGAASRSVKLAEIGNEAINIGRAEMNLTQQTQNLLRNGPAGRLGSKTAWDRVLGAASKIPFLDGLADAGQLMRIGAKSGLTKGELSMVGLGGLRRGISEWNFASSEAVVEAGGTYGDTYDLLYKKYEDQGIKVTPEIREQISQDAMRAATKDYAINVGILGVTNKIMFNNLFRSFGTDSKFINLLTKEGGRVLSVMGRTEGGKTLALSMPKSFWGVIGNKKDIIAFGNKLGENYGKTLYRKELAKDLVRGFSRFEVMEGIQENLQEGTSVGIKKYYSDLYDRGVASWGDSFKEGIESQFSKTGWKTFLSGALMGFFTRPVTGAVQSAKRSFDESRAKKGDPNHVDALTRSLKEMNAYYADPEKVLFDPIRAIKEQVQLNTGMAKASSQGQKYDYFNNHDSAMIKLAIHAKNTGTFDTFIELTKAYGTEYTEKEFEEATGINIKQTKFGSVQAYTNDLVGKLTRYSELHDKYTSMYSNHLTMSDLTSDPYRKQRYAFNQMAIRNAISIVAFNEAKAEASTRRAADISRKISEIEGIGNAALSTFNNVTSYDKAQDTLRILENELKILRESPDKSESTKKAISEKEEEIQHLTEWTKLAYEESTDEEGEKSYIPFNVRALSPESRNKLVETLSKYYNLKNKQSGLSTNIKTQDVVKVLTDINDYQKLSEDTKEHIDAVNLLSDPNNFTKVAISHRSASVAAFARVAHDTYKELESQSGVFEEYLKKNPNDLNTLLSIARSPFNAYESMDVVLKAIQNINDLTEEQNEENQKEAEKKLLLVLQKAEENQKRKKAVNLAELSEKEQLEFISNHYRQSDDGDFIERYYISTIDDQRVVTHTIKLDDIEKHYGKKTGEDVTEEQLVEYLIDAEQLLWNKENPTAQKPKNNSANRAATTTTLVKKIRNLVGQKVSVKGRKGTIAIENQKYVVKFDDNENDTVELGPEETQPIVFNWELDEATSKMVAVEADPNASLSLDNFPEITLLDENLTEGDQEITGVTRDSKTIKVQDISHNVEYIDMDTIKIDGKQFSIARDEQGDITAIEHKKGRKVIRYNREDMFSDPTGLAAEHISLVEQFFFQIAEFTDEQLDRMTEQAKNEGVAEEGKTIRPKKTKGKKTPSEMQRDEDIEAILFDMTNDQAIIFDKVLSAKTNQDLENIPSEDRENIKNWALDAIKKLGKLDASEQVELLLDTVINPISKLTNEFNNRDGSTKRVTKKKSKSPTGTKKDGTTAGKKGDTSEVKGNSIKGAAGAVERIYDSKEVKVEIEDLISTSTESIYTIKETTEAKRTYKFTKKAYKQNLSKAEKPETDPFEDSDLKLC